MASYDNGGLNVGSLKAFNIALINKWRWHYLTNPGDFWVSIIKSIHGNNFDSILGNQSSPWASIVSTYLHSVRSNFLPTDCYKLNVGNGRNIHFWPDSWCGVEKLSTHFNRLFHLDTNKDDYLADKWVNGEWK
ncbi:uncharacterized protein [Rutidosis leptorrhynchoides]|uniref:uncharacterized protein n=1 Tax=Rutidosis leptorrhynchoides TaxID=125765 RepID=UPI003A9A13B9